MNNTNESRKQMEFTEDAIAREYEMLSQNYRGYKFPLMHRRIKPTDTIQLAKVIKENYQALKGFVGWATYSDKWDFKEVNRFVMDHVNDDFLRQHFIFTLGKEIVGMGSLLPMKTPYHAQVSLWVVRKHQGNGIGRAIVKTLEWYAFEVWGFDSLFYEHDAYNESSKQVPQKLGYQFSHTFESKINAAQETGFWFSWRKNRPSNMSPGIFQGAPIDQFTDIRHKV